MEISGNLLEQLADLHVSDRFGVDKAIRSAMSDVIALMDDRVFKKGHDANEGMIGTYSEWWAAERRKKGKQTQFVDFRFDGLLQQSITIMPNIDATTWAIGFRNQVQAEKAAKIQKTKKKTVFELTKKEKDRLFKTFFAKLLKK